MSLTTGIRLIQFQYQDDQLTGLLDLADDFAQQNGNRNSISRTSRDTGKVDAMTYKLGLDYIFKESMLYGFYAKGFKPKGFNPVNDPNLTRFDSETNDYFELGYKSQLLKGKLNLDTALFYNSINDLQVSKIIGRTSIVDNADASIMGIDSNMSISLPFNIRLNSSLSLIDSKIKHLKTKDPQFPYGYDVTIDESVNNGEPVSTLVDTAQSNPGGSAEDIAQGSASTYVTTLLVNGEQKPMYSSFGDICTQYFTFIPVPSCPDTDGVELDLKNNKLPGTSDISFSFGLEKTFNDIWSRQLSTRLDYIWKGSYYTDLFNRDFLKVPGYDEINLEMRYQPQSRKWVSKFYIKNLQNTRNVTNYSMMSVAAGSPIYAFYLKPRTYGFSFTYHF